MTWPLAVAVVSAAGTRCPFLIFFRSLTSRAILAETGLPGPPGSGQGAHAREDLPCRTLRVPARIGAREHQQDLAEAGAPVRLDLLERAVDGLEAHPHRAA